MIIVDTNIVKEPLKPEPDRAILTWLDRQEPGTLFLTATVLSEALFGFERLPNGKRKSAFLEGFATFVRQRFHNAILPFDESAARRFAVLIADAQRKGKAIQVSDGQIAAVALVRDYSVATRDTAPFHAAGCRVINPWTD
jgi:toxin FitB